MMQAANSWEVAWKTRLQPMAYLQAAQFQLQALHLQNNSHTDMN